TIDSASVFTVDTDDLQIVRKYQRSGLVTQARNINDDYHLQFAAPLVRIILGRLLYNAPLNVERSPDDFDMFLIMSIERMRPSVLSTSLSRDVNRNASLIERQWQNEWYRAAMTAVLQLTLMLAQFSACLDLLIITSTA